MFEQLKKLAMIGLGGTALAIEKVSEYVDGLVKQGKLTVDEGKKLTEELIRSKEKEVSEKGRKEIETILMEMNIAQQKDIDVLIDRIEELERQLAQKEE